MSEFILPSLFLIILPGVIIAEYTGEEIFVFQFSSGLRRLTLGLLSTLFLYLWWTIKWHGGFFSYVFMWICVACGVIALVLIPLGMLQLLGAMMYTIKYGRHVPAFDTRVVCPHCHASRITRRSTLRSVLGIGLLFVTHLLLLTITMTAEWDGWAGLLYLALPFSFAAVLAAGYSGVFGQNRCKSCQHAWR
jgi:hypothetical protein